MTTRIACLHTADSNVAVFEAARAALGADVALTHTVRPDLLAAAEAAGGLTSEIARRTADALRDLRAGADVVLLTCSTLGAAVDDPALHDMPLDGPPLLRVDAALARAAVQNGGRVVALVAVETTVQPTRAIFEAAAEATGATVEIRLVPDAWAAFKAGDHGRYLELIARAADGALREGATRVALAQASMAGAAQRTTALPRPLTSPAAGLEASVAAA